VVVGAGADTTGNALTITTFHLLANPDICARLRKELEEAIPDRFQPAKLSFVENLPYLVSSLTALIRLTLTAPRLRSSTRV
jgi:cytochrome P450